MMEALEILKEIIENGFTIVTVIAILNILLNWYESRRKRHAYEAMEHKIDAILKKEGIAWNGQQDESRKAQRSLNTLFRLCLVVISRVVKKLRRERKMNQAVNYAVLLSAIIGALKLILQPFGIDLTGITDENVNAMANGFAALMVLIGIVRDNITKLRQSMKGGAASESAQRTNTFESNQ